MYDIEYINNDIFIYNDMITHYSVFQIIHDIFDPQILHGNHSSDAEVASLVDHGILRFGRRKILEQCDPSLLMISILVWTLLGNK